MGPIKWLRLHPVTVAYAATTLGASMMNAVFNFYYVKIYLNRFHVSESWFQVSQVVFMIWNAVNDPLFGYMQDNFNYSWIKSRRHSILYGAPLFVLSFLVPWFPWGDYSSPTWLAGFQLMFSLCFYDALFTYVLLAQCALFTEISHKQEDRIRLVRYSQVAGFVGHFSVFFCNMISDNLQKYDLFLTTTVVIATISLSCMIYSGRNVYTEYERPLHSKEENAKDSDVEQKVDAGNIRSSDYTMLQQIWHILSQPNFICFVFMNLLQIFHQTWLVNFTGIICDSLIPDTVISSSLRSVFYGSLHVAPQVVVILGAPIVAKLGYYNIIGNSFFIKIALGIFLFLMGPRPWGLVCFFLMEYINGGAVFSLFNLPLSDIIDADKAKYMRKHPLSSMVFGTNALITKPAQSLAPMLVVAILNSYGYQQFKAISMATRTPQLSKDDVQRTDVRDLTSAMFYMACIIPVVVGICQKIIWKFYTIRGSHLTMSRYVET